MVDLTESYDLVVVGAGQAGPPIALHEARAGHSVALVERRALGGTCVNDGCTPTKTLRKSARVAHLARRASEFGVDTEGFTVDFAAVMGRVREVVGASRSGLTETITRQSGLTYIAGDAVFAGRDGEQILVEVAGRRVRAPRVVINTGTRAFIPPIPGLESVDYLDNTSVLQLQELPEHLLVLGGSYIGLELGQIFRRLGSDVTIIERAPLPAAREDVDVSGAIAELMRSEGIDLRLGVAATGVTNSHEVSVELDDGSSVGGSHLLVALGRVPNTDTLNLQSIGVETDARGWIATDNQLATSAPGVWAVGDVNRQGAFTHTSYHDHEILLDVWSGRGRTTDRLATYAMFTDPPLGHVGLYEADARRQVAEGRRISQAVLPMTAVSRAREESETSGLIKLLIDEDSERLVGATMLGVGADEIIQTVSLLIAANASWRTVRDTLPIHPTVTEFLPTILDRRQPLEVMLP